ncbi:MAG TPA: RNB domain-containing ribonuclease [Jiangellaceae bacterium]|nr:RNB domain-containing ribonuclease [Jiangellaceae bacterium]
MPSRHLRLVADDAARLRAALDKIRAELEVPGEFPADAIAEASAAAAAATTPDRDLTDVPFVTIDPPSSMDLDQALHLSRDGRAFLVRYAIADVASFVTPGGPVDIEAHRRGVTFYGPDRRAPLHPVELSEGAASLLPDEERPALVWELRLDSSGDLTGTELTRARVRSRAKLSYEGVQSDLDAGTAGDMLGLLPEIGRLRLEQEGARGGVSLPVPEQEIVTRPEGGYGLEHRSPLPAEAWNAQLSLLAGTAAAVLMRQGGVGIFRTLPPAQQRDVERLRRTARALGIDWPQGLPYADLIRSLDPAPAAHAAFLNEATTLFRGAGYVAFDGSVPDDAGHAAIAAEYAHVTAPLRRLVDRYGLEVCAAITAGTEVPDWVRAALPGLPEVMAETGRRAGAYEGACVAVVEAAIMTGREDEVFPGVVVDVVEKDDRGEVVIAEPAVRGRVAGRDLPLGQDVSVRLVEASIEARQITFALA